MGSYWRYSMRRGGWTLAFLVSLSLSLLLRHIHHMEGKERRRLGQRILTSLLRRDPLHLILKQNISTAFGYQPYDKIFLELYEPLGYTLRKDYKNAEKLGPFLPLDPPRETCPSILSQWLTINSEKITNNPPKLIPESLRKQFLLNGYAKFGEYYFNDAKNSDRGAILNWTKKNVEEHVPFIRTNSYSDWFPFPYGSNSGALFMAMRKYGAEGRGLVVGSLTPWVEAGALDLGADSVMTAEYQPISTDHPSLKTRHPLELAKDLSLLHHFDFAASFSSIEHSGLGRYGDILDPWGDIREVRKVRCFLKDRGLFYLGLPCGKEGDALYWNSDRIYGMIRWSLLAAGWDVLDIFQGNNPLPLDTEIDFQVCGEKGKGTFPHTGGQSVVVLRKLSDDRYTRRPTTTQ